MVDEGLRGVSILVVVESVLLGVGVGSETAFAIEEVADKRSAQQVGFTNDTRRGIEQFVRTNGYESIEKSVCQKKRLRL
ncbi:hypothetical protein TNCV_2916751 [Trichonephila clavipes]|nr:hypothetical protein TNCV_2916751 [Trichonephila clavipes]